MKSIKEKSNEYGLQYPVIHYDADGNTYDDVDKPSMDFEAGANYVLEHLSMTISVSEDSYLRDNLKKMIEQLKEK